MSEIPKLDRLPQAAWVSETNENSPELGEFLIDLWKWLNEEEGRCIYTAEGLLWELALRARAYRYWKIQAVGDEARSLDDPKFWDAPRQQNRHPSNDHAAYLRSRAMQRKLRESEYTLPDSVDWKHKSA